MGCPLSRSVITAGLIFILLLAYFGVRTVLRGAPETETAAQVEEVAPEDVRPEVIVQEVSQQAHSVFATLKGRTEADRSVVVRAETTGMVTATPATEGREVNRGAVLCRLDVEAREVRVKQAQAELDARTLDWTAARELEEKGWTSPTSAAAAKAAYDAAVAAMDSAMIEMDRTVIRAPFRGVFDERTAEIGDFLSPGAACGTVVDLDPIIVVVDATEAQAGRFAEGQTAAITLASGQALEGTVRYVSRTASQATRTFRIEVAAPNPDYAIAAGLTASLRVAMGEMPASRISPALLVLHDDGRVGVRYVDAADQVRFTEVDVVDDADQGVFVTGLPNGARLLASGQDYIREGVLVRPVAPEGL